FSDRERRAADAERKRLARLAKKQADFGSVTPPVASEQDEQVFEELERELEALERRVLVARSRALPPGRIHHHGFPDHGLLVEEAEAVRDRAELYVRWRFAAFRAGEVGRAGAWGGRGGGGPLFCVCWYTTAPVC